MTGVGRIDLEMEGIPKMEEVLTVVLSLKGSHLTARRISICPVPPVVRPVRDILGDNISALRIIEPPKANGGRATDGSLRTQRTTSSGSLASSNGNPTELKREDSGILIDFDAVPETPIAAIPDRQQTAANQSVAQPTTLSHADNWACFDSAPAVKTSQASTNSNSLESFAFTVVGSNICTSSNHSIHVPIRGWYSCSCSEHINARSRWWSPSRSSWIGIRNAI